MANEGMNSAENLLKASQHKQAVEQQQQQTNNLLAPYGTCEKYCK